MFVRAYSFRHPVAALAIVSLAGCLTSGCSTFSGKTSPAPSDSAERSDSAGAPDNAERSDSAGIPDSAASTGRTDTQIFVGDTLEMNYDPNVIMKRAESFHEKEGYAEAIVEYRHFLDLHHNHVLAPYAHYRLALSHFKMIGTVDLDVTPAKMAREAFTALMADFPGSQYEAEALDAIRRCDRHLAQHDLFIGKFYYRKEAYMAAAKRFRKVADSHPRMEEAVESKLYLAKTYQAIGAGEWAQDWVLALVQQHPRHPLREEGLQLLAALYQEQPDLADTDPMNRRALLTSLVPADPALFENHPSNTMRATASSRQSGFLTSSTSTPCRVGAWCETMGAPSDSIPTPRSPVLYSATCRPGTWCE